jgi:hypothetical protein
MNHIERAYQELEVGTLRPPAADLQTRRLIPDNPPAPQTKPIPPIVRKVAVILGARLGGTHVLEALKSSGVCIEGIYDASNSAPGLSDARRYGIPVYSGAWSELGKMLNRCAQHDNTNVYVFLPSRDAKFITFARRHFGAAERQFPRKFKLFQMDRDFGDYEPPAKLFSLIRDN